LGKPFIRFGFLVRSCFWLPACFAVEGGGGPEHPNSGFLVWASTVQRIAQPKEHAEVWIVAEHAIDQSSTRRNNLTRQLDKGVQKRLELHP